MTDGINNPVVVNCRDCGAHRTVYGSELLVPLFCLECGSKEVHKTVARMNRDWTCLCPECIREKMDHRERMQSLGLHNVQEPGK